MVCSAALLAKRALVTLLHGLAAAYGLNIRCTRDSPDATILRAFRQVALKAHPDRGGDLSHQQQLNDARGAWEAAKQRRRRGNEQVPALVGNHSAQ